MGGISADGTRLWISGRYNSTVYEFDTATGAVVRRVAVGSGPHGLCVYPQPGRYSLGHTGIFR
jgi:YVTN family beta-propeller protein